MSFSIQELERTVYANLVNKVVEMGYLPDREIANTEQLYAAALAVVIANKGFSIEVKGVGSPRDREGKNNFKIVLIRKNTKRGDIGAEWTTYFEQTGDTFTKYQRSGISKDFPFEIRAIGNGTEGQRIMEELIYDAFGTNKYLPAIIMDQGLKVFNVNKTFLFTYTGDFDLTNGQMSERIFVYVAIDIFTKPLGLHPDVVLRSDVVQLRDITIKIGPAVNPANPTPAERADAQPLINEEIE